MAYTYNTGNPVGASGSTDPRDLIDNAQVIDQYATATEVSAPDRLGVTRKTWAGLESDVNTAIATYTMFTAVGDWTTSTAYALNDVWTHTVSGDKYLVLAAYTSGANEAADIAGGTVTLFRGRYQEEFTSLAAMKAAIPSYAGQSFYLSAGGRSGTFIWDESDLSSTLVTSTATSDSVDSGTDTITDANHPFSDGNGVIVTADVNGLSVNTVYWVVNSTATAYQLSATYGGLAVDLTGTTNVTVKSLLDPLNGVYVTPEGDFTGASGAWVRKLDGYVTPGMFGGGGTAIQAIINLNLIAEIPISTSVSVASVIEGNSSTKAWKGLRGQGDSSVLDMQNGGAIKLRNRGRGGHLGIDQWTNAPVCNLSVDAEGFSESVFILGPDVNGGDAIDDVNKSCNGQKFSDVNIINGASGQLSFECNFSTKCTWNNVIHKDGDGGWHFYTGANVGASDEHDLYSCAAMSAETAGVSAYMDTVNTCVVNFNGGTLQINNGWGFGFVGIGNHHPLIFNFYGTHFEANGTYGLSTAGNVTIRNDSNSREPSHGLVDNCAVLLNRCNAFDGFFQVINRGILTITGGSYNLTHKNLFEGGDGSGVVVMDSPTLINPGASFDGIIDVKSTPILVGTANERQFLAGKIPNQITQLKAIGTSSVCFSDPYFLSGVNNYTASTTTAPTVAANINNPLFGAQSLEVIFNPSVGNLDTNSVYFAFGTINLLAGEYCAYSASMYSDIEEIYEITHVSSPNGENLGSAKIRIPAGRWTRVVYLIRNKYGADQTSNRIDIYPTSANGPTLNIDAHACVVGDRLDVLSVLRGCVPE